jgi:hypothetical protein
MYNTIMLIFYGIMSNADGNKAGGRGNLMAALAWEAFISFSKTKTEKQKY